MCSDQENGGSRHVWTVIKLATFLLCLAGFIGNSYMIFVQFIVKKTITSQNVEKNDDGLLLPSVTMCSLSGFKEEMDEYEDLELENYLQKTLYFEDIFYGYYDNEWTYYDLESMTSNTTQMKITTTYSQYKGRCHTLTYQKLVSDVIFEVLNSFGKISGCYDLIFKKHFFTILYRLHQEKK